MGLNLNVGSAMSKITSGLTSNKLAGKTSFNTSNLDTITNTLSGKSKVQLKNYTYQYQVKKLQLIIPDEDEPFTILKEAKVKWEFAPEYGEDIAKEHEKYITEYFNGPVFITDWPKDIKAFYMKLNPDGETVAAVDLEVPGAGELMGGSQREENYDKLVKRMDELKMEKDSMDWYLNLRKFGGCPHSGFGMGFERLLIYLTGVENIRDVIPYPRTPGNCEY